MIVEVEGVAPSGRQLEIRTPRLPPPKQRPAPGKAGLVTLGTAISRQQRGAVLRIRALLSPHWESERSP